MIFEVAEVIRSHVLANAGVEVARTYVAPSPRWAREACAQWVVHYETTRTVNLGEGRIPAQRGAGFSGQCATIPVHDLVATYVAPCYPAGDDEGNPASDQVISEWTRGFLRDCERLGAALGDADALRSPLGVIGLLSELTIGQTVPSHGGLVGTMAWPISVNAF